MSKFCNAKVVFVINRLAKKNQEPLLFEQTAQLKTCNVNETKNQV